MIIKHLSELKKTWFWLAIGWTILIILLCLAKQSDLPSLTIEVNHLDKIVHFGFHFVFTLLWAFYFFASKKELSVWLIVSIVFCSICFGISIEILQELFTTTRKADSMDVISNTIGALVAGSIANKIVKNQTHLK